MFQNVSGKHMIHIYQKNNRNDNCLYIELDKNKFNNSINDKLEIKIKNIELKKCKDKIIFSNEKDPFELTTNKLEMFYDTSVGVQESTDKITKKQYDNSKNKNRFNVGDGVFVL